MKAKNLTMKNPTDEHLSACEHIRDAQVIVLAAALAAGGLPNQRADIDREFNAIFDRLPDHVSMADVNLAVAERVVAIQKKVC